MANLASGKMERTASAMMWEAECRMDSRRRARVFSSVGAFLDSRAYSIPLGSVMSAGTGGYSWEGGFSVLGNRGVFYTMGVVA